MQSYGVMQRRGGACLCSWVKHQAQCWPSRLGTEHACLSCVVTCCERAENATISNTDRPDDPVLSGSSQRLDEETP